jgi:GDP-D-mannose 3',5'-epimerase
MKKVAVVLGAGGFIGNHLVNRLKNEGYWVRGVDLKLPEFSTTNADEFIVGDLRDNSLVTRALYGPDQRSVAGKDSINSVDEVYQLAADMGGAGYIFTGEHDADVMHNSALINLNVAEIARTHGVKKLFYSSSACMYPGHNQLDPNNPNCEESSAYPANPDSEYGWEKLFSERLYLAYNRNYGLDVRIGRFHNIFGTHCSWNNGKEKAPAAVCRKVAEAKDGGEIEIWGDGEQTRSFLYIDECIDGVMRLMNSEYIYPVNIGSEEMVTINQLVSMTAKIANKNITIKHIDGPIGVRGRNSDNKLIYKEIGWKPSQPLETGIAKSYEWINHQLNG